MGYKCKSFGRMEVFKMVLLNVSGDFERARRESLRLWRNCGVLYGSLGALLALGLSGALPGDSLGGYVISTALAAHEHRISIELTWNYQPGAFKNEPKQSKRVLTKCLRFTLFFSSKVCLATRARDAAPYSLFWRSTGASCGFLGFWTLYIHVPSVIWAILGARRIKKRPKQSKGVRTKRLRNKDNTSLTWDSL